MRARLGAGVCVIFVVSYLHVVDWVVRKKAPQQQQHFVVPPSSGDEVPGQDDLLTSHKLDTVWEGVVNVVEVAEEEEEEEEGWLIREQERLLEMIGAVRGDDADGVPVCGHSPGRARYYATSSRKDFVGFVSEELYELGLCAWRKRKRGYDVYVGQQFESLHSAATARGMYLANYIRDGAVVSSLPGLLETVGTKRSLAQLFSDCQRRPSTLCRRAHWLPPGFNVDTNGGGGGKFAVRQAALRVLRGETPVAASSSYLLTSRAQTLHAAFVQKHHSSKAKAAKSETSTWIVKRQNGTFLGKGIHLATLDLAHHRTDAELKKWLLANFAHPRCRSAATSQHRSRVPSGCAGRDVSFQAFSERPLLADGRKFDLRAWAVVTSLQPLRVALLRHAYPKISSVKFDADTLDLANGLDPDSPGFDVLQCMHVQMMLGDNCNMSVHRFRTLFPGHQYPETTASPVFEQMLGAPKNWFSAVVWPQLERAVTDLLLLVKGRLLDKQAATFTKEVNPDRYRRFALLSVDAIVDADGKLWLEEVNTNGIVMGTHAYAGGVRDFFRDDDYFRGLLRLVGADGFPNRKRYARQLKDALDDFCRNTTRLPCSAIGRNAISLAVDEEAHAGPHWYRLYPPLRRISSLKKGKKGFPGWWPDQARMPDFRVARESSLDRLVRSFMDTVDTRTIHGRTQVPGHARWHQRPSFENHSLAAKRYSQLLTKRAHRTSTKLKMTRA